jgi:hypothetical protein
MKSIALVLVVAVLGMLAWVLLHSSHHVAVVVNGHPLVGPAKLAAEGWGLLVGIVALFCAAILLVFVFAGTALMVLGVLVPAGFVAALFVFPFLLPLLVPLFIVWIFVAAARKGSRPPAP